VTLKDYTSMGWTRLILSSSFAPHASSSQVLVGTCPPMKEEVPLGFLRGSMMMSLLKIPPSRSSSISRYSSHENAA
jgi:hypothetical protein